MESVLRKTELLPWLRQRDMKVAGLPKQAAIWGDALHDLWQWPFQELKFNDRFPATNSDRRRSLVCPEETLTSATWLPAFAPEPPLGGKEAAIHVEHGKR